MPFWEAPFGWGRRGNTNTGLALVGRNNRGIQALKQNIAGGYDLFYRLKGQRSLKIDRNLDWPKILDSE